jgi:hypothetical protein
LAEFVDQLRGVHGGAIEVVGLADHHQDNVATEACVCRHAADDLGVLAVPSIYAIAPGWWVAGRRRSVRESRSAAGVNALAAARSVGGSVILGDTGRLGIGHFMKQREDFMETLTGVEAGAPISARTTGRHVDRRRYSDRGLAVITIGDDGRVDAECRTF